MKNNIDKVEKIKDLKGDSDFKVLIMSIIIVFVVTIVISVLFSLVYKVVLVQENVFKKSNQEFDNLDFTITVNDTGDIVIKEIWDIDIKETRTLFKNFELDPKFYNGMKAVTVKELVANGTTVNYKKIDEYREHLDNGTFYVLGDGENHLEIAWGVPYSDNIEEKKYEITYTLSKAMVNYNDCSEFYWQLLGDQFSIPAKKITGVINLPEGIENKNDIKVWGHIKSLSGKIKIVDEKTISFDVTNYKGYEYLEVRFLLPKGIINTKDGNNRDFYRVEAAVNEEKRWADYSNEIRLDNTIILYLAAMVIIGLILAEFSLVFKYINTAKENRKKKIKPEIDFEYFREIPNKDLSPGEATFLMYSTNEPTHGSFDNVFVATILYLINKGYFDAHKDENDRSYLKITKKGMEYRDSYRYGRKETDGLSEDVVKIFDYILKIFGEGNILYLTQVKVYINADENHGAEYLELVNEVQTKIEVAQSVKGNINQESRKQLKQIQTEKAFNWGIIFLLVAAIQYLNYYFMSGMLLFVYIFMILPAVNLSILNFSKKSISYLTQKGLDESDKWDALKTYIKEYTLLNERDEFQVQLWEEYLVYATAFGIAEDVLKNMEPEYKEKFKVSPYLLMIIDDEFDRFRDDFRVISNEYIYSSIRKATGGASLIGSVTSGKSSGFGAGGGFSNGGGFGGGRSRRWW